MKDERVFTVGEANALLTQTRETLERTRELRQSAASLERKLERLTAVWADEVRHPDHADHEEYVQYRRAIVAIDRDILELIETELTDRGIVVPLDGLERGIAHFPTTLGGREVFLCWASDEPEVQHWHETDEGHAARRSIDLAARPDESPGQSTPPDLS